MNFLRNTVSELISLFIDDGALAIFIVVLIAAVTAAVHYAAILPLIGSLCLLTGLVAILTESVFRAVRRERP